MQSIIEVFRMNEVSIAVRCKIIIQLGHAINAEHRMNITEPLVYELVKQLDPENKDVETLSTEAVLKWLLTHGYVRKKHYFYAFTN